MDYNLLIMLETSNPLARRRLTLFIIILATIPCYCIGLVAISLAPDNSPTATPSPTFAATATVPSLTFSPDPSIFTQTPSNTPTVTPTPTDTNTPTYTPSVTATETVFVPPTDTATNTMTFTPSPTWTPSSTPSRTPTPPNTPTATITSFPITTAAP